MTDTYLAAETEADLYDAHTEPDIEPPTRAATPVEPSTGTSQSEEIDTDFSSVDIRPDTEPPSFDLDTTDGEPGHNHDTEIDSEALDTVTLTDLAPGIAAAGSGADLYVTDQRTNEYGTERAAIDGETFAAKDIIKFDWDVTHHEFDGETEQWIVDAAALDELQTRLEDAGYTVEF